MTDQSRFDRMLDAATDRQAEIGKASADVQTLLTAAGVNPEQVAFLASNPSLVDLIRRKPELAYEYARKFPSGSVQDYQTQAQAWGFGTTAFGSPLEGSGGADAMAMNLAASQPSTSVTGAVRYPNGVMVGPNGEVIFPNDPTVAGSQSWLMGVSEWSDDKIAKWRETLKDAGYIDSAKGGATVDFIEALRTYHNNRYAYGGGKPVAFEVESQKVTAEDFDGIIDRNILRGEVRTWLAQAYGDEGSEDEQRFWVERLREVALRAARKKGYSPGNAAAVASSKVEQEFLDSPSVKTAIDNDYENTSLKEDLQMAAQASDFLAFGR